MKLKEALQENYGNEGWEQHNNVLHLDYEGNMWLVTLDADEMRSYHLEGWIPANTRKEDPKVHDLAQSYGMLKEKCEKNGIPCPPVELVNSLK